MTLLLLIPTILHAGNNRVEKPLIVKEKQAVLQALIDYDEEQTQQSVTVRSKTLPKCVEPKNDDQKAEYMKCFGLHLQQQKLQKAEVDYNVKHEVNLYYINDKSFTKSYFDNGKINDISKLELKEYTKQILTIIWAIII